MNALIRPKLGFSSGAPDAKLAERLSSAGAEAARRRFTPEFMNRIDHIVTFRPLGQTELQQILEIELDAVRDRLARATASTGIGLTVDEPTRELLLTEGTDTRYGARHLKRAVERRLVHPLSNRLATGQIGAGDYVTIERDGERLTFSKRAVEERANAAA